MIGVKGLQCPYTIIKDLSKEQMEDLKKLESHPKQAVDGIKIVYQFDRDQSVQLSSLLHYSKPKQKQQDQQFIVVLDFQWIKIVECILSHYYEMIKYKFQHNELKPEFIWIHLNQRFSNLQNKEIKIVDITFTNYQFLGEQNNNISDIISQIQTTCFNKYNQIDKIKQLRNKYDENSDQKQDIILIQYEKTYELLKKLKEKKNQQKFKQLINEALENWYDQKVAYNDFQEIFQKSLIIKEYQWSIIQNEQINQHLNQNYEKYQQDIFDLLFKEFIENGLKNLTIEIKQRRNREIQYFYAVSEFYKVFVDLKRHYSNYLQLSLKGDYIERILKYSQEIADYQEVDHLGLNFQRVKTRYINEQIMAFESGLLSQINNLF